MELADFYQKILKPPHPWRVSRVQLDANSDRVDDVWLEHERCYRFLCPLCRQECSTYDHAEERGWRHLDTCECQTFLHARPPRVSCPEHGIHNGDFPVATAGNGMTCRMEALCIRHLVQCTLQGTAELLDISWDILHSIAERAVKRGLQRRGDSMPKNPGIDEKQVFARHRYFTIMTDLKGGCVYDVADKRTIKELTPWFQKHGEQLKGVKHLAMDMSAGYGRLAADFAPQATICFDHFHVQQVIQRAVEATRKDEQATITDNLRRMMFKSRFLFLCNKENLPENRAEDFEAVKAVAVKTSRTWAIKEKLRDLWRESEGSRETAADFFKKWLWWGTHSRLKHVVSAAHTLKKHLDGILNAVESKVTNAVTEGLNQKIEAIKRSACGFRNKDSFKTTILFHCGNLDMLPY